MDAILNSFQNLFFIFLAFTDDCEKRETIYLFLEINAVRFIIWFLLLSCDDEETHLRSAEGVRFLRSLRTVPRNDVLRFQPVGAASSRDKKVSLRGVKRCGNLSTQSPTLERCLYFPCSTFTKIALRK